MESMTSDVTSHSEKEYCRFYVLTYNGRRCVLMSVDKWFKVKEDFYKRFCSRGGSGCPLLNNVLKRIKAMRHRIPKSVKVVQMQRK